jgi:hypothetical protein
MFPLHYKPLKIRWSEGKGGKRNQNERRHPPPTK